jgi:hypothetical protein
MANSQLDTFLRHLRRVVLPAELTDAQLLERFVHSRDERRLSFYSGDMAPWCFESV